MSTIGNVGKNVSIRYKVESTFGTPVTGGSGEEFRFHEGAPGLAFTRGLVEDPESRNDGQRSQMRLGSHKVGGSLPGTLSVGTFNTLLGALFRNTFTAAATLLTCDNGATYTSLAVTNQNTLTLVGSGSFLGLGVKVGDVVRLSATAADDDINAVVATVAANVITVLGTPWANFSADTNALLKSTKKITNSATLTRSSYTFEQYYTDIDESEQFAGCRIVSMKLTFKPNSVVMVEFGIAGKTMTNLITSSAPGLTSPTQYTSIGLVVSDASLYLAGTIIATITGGELMFDLGGDGVDVVGSASTPDIYEGTMKVSGTLTAVRTALAGSHLARFLSETDNVEMSLLMVEPDAAVPIDFFHVFVPRIKYAGVTVGGLGTTAPLIETIPIYAAAKAPTTGYDTATASICTSA
jgi:hypothetical protein